MSQKIDYVQAAEDILDYIESEGGSVENKREIYRGCEEASQMILRPLIDQLEEQGVVVPVQNGRRIGYQLEDRSVFSAEHIRKKESSKESYSDSIATAARELVEENDQMTWAQLVGTLYNETREEDDDDHRLGCYKIGTEKFLRELGVFLSEVKKGEEAGLKIVEAESDTTEVYETTDV